VPRTGFRPGFKSECESLAATLRAEIGVGASDPLDTRSLAAHLGVPVHPVSSLAGNGAAAAAVDYVRTIDPSVMSAMTIFPDWPRRHRVIIFNDANPPQRQNSDLAHELAHGLYLHEPRHAIVQGCRDYSKLGAAHILAGAHGSGAPAYLCARTSPDRACPSKNSTRAARPHSSPSAALADLFVTSWYVTVLRYLPTQRPPV
jgi:hypothetical protein